MPFLIRHGKGISKPNFVKVNIAEIDTVLQ